MHRYHGVVSAFHKTGMQARNVTTHCYEMLFSDKPFFFVSESDAGESEAV